MPAHHGSCEIETPARQEFFDVTTQFEEFVAGTGSVTVSPWPTRRTPAAAWSCRRSPRTLTYYGTQLLLQDTLNVLAKIAPPTRHEGQYLHPGPVHIRNAAELRDELPEWGLNTDGHIISSILGRSETVPLVDGALRPRRVRPGVFRRPRLRPGPHPHRPLPGARRLTVLVYAVDLGTTNVKVVLYDEHLRRLAVASAPAVYRRAGDRVEFSARRSVRPGRRPV